MYLVSTPEERHVESSAVSSPMCLNAKMTRDLVITPKEKVSRRMALPLHGVYLHQENVEAYLDWEMKVEQLFACHRVSEERKVPLATLSFRDNDVYWWNALESKGAFIRTLP